MGFKTALTVTFLGLLGLTSAQNTCSCFGDCSSGTDCECPGGTTNGCKITVLAPDGTSTGLTVSGKDLICTHEGTISTCMTREGRQGTITNGFDASDVWRFSILENGEGNCTLDLPNETAECIGQAPASLAGWDFSCSSQQPGAVISTNAVEGNVCVWDAPIAKCNEDVVCKIQSNDYEEIECEGLTCEGLSEDGGVIVMATDNTAEVRYSELTSCAYNCKCGSAREGCWSEHLGALVEGGVDAAEVCSVDCDCLPGQHPECFCSDITCETCKCVGDADLTTTTPVPGGSTTIPAPGAAMGNTSLTSGLVAVVAAAVGLIQ